MKYRIKRLLGFVLLALSVFFVGGYYLEVMPGALSGLLAGTRAESTYESGHPEEFRAPAYAGEPYVVLNGGNPGFDSIFENGTVECFEEYSPLDELGRCGQAFACIDRSMMPSEPRGQIGNIRPAGWHTVKYNDLIEGNYLYNRCHLIAYVLTGQNANEKNLITGTRYLNTVGMLPFEIEAADYLEHSRGHILYRVTPVYSGDNLIADGVIMEAASVEDHGRGLRFCVFVYNVQPGIEIDYRTGESRRK